MNTLETQLLRFPTDYTETCTIRWFHQRVGNGGDDIKA